ncbi:rhomboid-like protein [Streptomyces sp. NPDC001820]|uniref:rhomboid-like protein n=1 Tax=Streptomyces sp. NPDC001820 TaxID=3364613 RepID=UPI003675C342
MHRPTTSDRATGQELLNAVPTQRARSAPVLTAPVPAPAVATDRATGQELLNAVPTQRARPAPVVTSPAPAPAAPTAVTPAVPVVAPAPGTSLPGWRRVLQLLPTPTGTPFTFCYVLVLIATSLFVQHGDPDAVSTLLRGSSTDVAHLMDRPLLVLGASALWVAGDPLGPYAIAFFFTLTALERRIGGWRTAGVFLAGHVGATLATEIPVGVSVVAGHLPATSLHRLDYGISFGLMASIGALAGLFGPLLRATLLGFVSLMLLQDLLAFVDPLTNWGHPLALLAGIACWPAVRRWARWRNGFALLDR